MNGQNQATPHTYPIRQLPDILQVIDSIRDSIDVHLILLGLLPIFAMAMLPQHLNPVEMSKSIFYHAGCPVCISAEHDIINLIGKNNVEIVHFGEHKGRIEEAEAAGVQSVPALVTPNGNVLHINFGASMADVKG